MPCCVREGKGQRGSLGVTGASGTPAKEASRGRAVKTRRGQDNISTAAGVT